MRPDAKSVRRAPRPSDQATARRMREQKQEDTACEIKIRQVLHRQGLRYRLHIRPIGSLNRRADIVFRRNKLAVFIDGCFWHGCPLHWKPPQRHSVWWTRKIALNRERDRETIRILRAHGWKVIRVWEHEESNHAARRIAKLLSQSGSCSR
jgi:DNA mismatch endonuclease, patch repair protein